jgi:nitrite reductase (NO-forming)
VGTPIRALARRVVVLRVVFGAIWAVDAFLKWQPSFADKFMDTVAEGAQHQPGWLSPWFDFWHNLVGSDPRLFAYAAAVIETLLAIGLILGLARRIVYIGGAAWSLGIWAIPEGFGAPFMAGAPDVGAGIMYAIIFGALYALESASGFDGGSVDSAIERRFPSWRLLAQPGERAPTALLGASSEPGEPKRYGPSAPATQPARDDLQSAGTERRRT